MADFSKDFVNVEGLKLEHAATNAERNSLHNTQKIAT
jgi:hypothetical protein